MIVLHPRQHIHPPVEKLVKRIYPEVITIELGEDFYEPWKTFKTYWNQGHDIVYIEQHKLIRAAVRKEFEQCQSPWCIFPHELVDPGNWAKMSIGCVRWKTQFQERVSIQEMEDYHKDVLRAVDRPWCYPDPPPPEGGVCWAHHELVIQDVGLRYGFGFHNHWPGVKHIHVLEKEMHGLRRL